MRIIDKYQDFYDSMQYIYPDDLFTFDRGAYSYLLSKEDFMRYIDGHKYSWRADHYEDTYALLQVGNHFWLFKILPTATNEFISVTDYTWSVMAQYTDYQVKSELMQFKVLDILWSERRALEKYTDVEQIKTLIRSIITDTGTHTRYHRKHSIIAGTFKFYTAEEESYHIPILKETGIAKLVDAKEIYYAFDEYFSNQKTENEKTIADGTTNDMKIEAYGFDKKTSFRGKNK